MKPVRWWHPLARGGIVGALNLVAVAMVEWALRIDWKHALVFVWAVVWILLADQVTERLWR